jgi:hypothetical protein
LTGRTVIDQSNGDRPVERQTGQSEIRNGTEPDRPVAGTGSIPEIWLRS